MSYDELNIHQKINRKLLKGKAIVFENLPRELIQENSYGVPKSEWEEPIELWYASKADWAKKLIEKYKHLPWNKDCMSPEIGVVCDGREWLPIEGYQPPTFAPGRSWKNEVIPKGIELAIIN